MGYNIPKHTLCNFEHIIIVAVLWDLNAPIHWCDCQRLFLAEMSVRSNENNSFIIILKKLFFGSKYPTIHYLILKTEALVTVPYLCSEALQDMVLLSHYLTLQKVRLICQQRQIATWHSSILAQLNYANGRSICASIENACSPVT